MISTSSLILLTLLCTYPLVAGLYLLNLYYNSEPETINDARLILGILGASLGIFILIALITMAVNGDFNVVR